MKQIMIASLVAISALATVVPAVAAEPVGKMTAFQTVVSRLNGPNIGVGADIFLKDRLRSNATGLGMIVFDDESRRKNWPECKPDHRRVCLQSLHQARSLDNPRQQRID